MKDDGRVVTIVLLPGMDGTGDLFRSFVAAAPEGVRTIVVALPQEGAYEALLERITLPQGESVIVVGESFSGPLALQLAERGGVAGVVLVNSFIRAPYLRVLRWLPWALLFRFPPPAAVIRRLFLGATASQEAVAEVQRAIAKTPAEVLAARLRAILTLEPCRISVPVLYLRGTEDRLIRRVPEQVEVREIRAPHLLLQTAPAEAWRAIGGWLDGMNPNNSCRPRGFRVPFTVV